MDLYTEYFVTRADPRVEHLFLMKDPFLLIAILALYFYAIYIYLPNFMKNRKAYSLKLIIQAYNIFQIIACSYVFYGFLTSGWLTTFSLGCEQIDYSNGEETVRLLHFVHLCFLTKVVDLLETCFFILRHKESQVTKLHLWHHFSTVSSVWIICKYIGGGMSTLALMLNSLIHVIMYTYYFLAAYSPEMQKKIQPYKSRLTLLQMIQFCVIIIHGLQMLKPTCDVPTLAALVLIPNVIVIFAFFLNFYIQSYIKKSK